MNTMIDKKVYTEAYEVIKQEECFRSMLPKSVIETIKQKANHSEYEFQYDRNRNIIEQISRESLSFCISLYLEHIASEKEIEKFKYLLMQNEIEYKQLLYKKTDYLDSNEKKIIQKVKEKVRQELENVINQEAVGYDYYFELLLMERLKEHGIDWKPTREKIFGIMTD